MADREPRFPGIDWYCDNCNAFLNIQANFDDHHYVWKCSECGYKSSISRDNMMWQARFVKPIGDFLGWIRSVLVYVFIGLIIQLLTKREFPLTGMLVRYWVYTLAGYVVADVISMIFEKAIAKCCSDMKIGVYIITTPLVYLFGDIIRPFLEMIKSILGVFRFWLNKNPRLLITKIIFGILYTPIVVYVIIFVMNITN